MTAMMAIETAERSGDEIDDGLNHGLQRREGLVGRLRHGKVGGRELQQNDGRETDRRPQNCALPGGDFELHGGLLSIRTA